MNELPMDELDNLGEENQYEVVEELDERIRHFNSEVIIIFTTKRTFSNVLSEVEQTTLKHYYLELKVENKVYIFYEHLKCCGDDATIELVMNFILQIEVLHNQFTNDCPVYLVIMESVQGNHSIISNL